MIEWLAGGAPFGPEDHAAFEEDRREGNMRRLRVILPLMAVAELMLAFQFSGWGASRDAIPAAEVVFRNAHGTVYLVSGLGALLLWALQARGTAWIRDQVPLWASLAYFIHACCVVGIDALMFPKIQVFGGACLAVAILVALRPRRIVMAYSVAGIAYASAILTMQNDPTKVQPQLVLGLGLVGASLLLALFLHSARRRDFAKTLVISKQKAELEALNDTLQERVEEQVVALTRRAEEVERLNAQLQSQVRDRSRSLAAALRRLAAGQTGGNDLEGREIGGRFTLGSLIARGGMGAVYEGIDSTTGESVAIKVIRAGFAPLQMMERFLREAETAATISHPAVVRMLHVDIHDDGTFFQVQELVRGETVGASVERHGVFELTAATRVLEVLADALSAAHARGVIHRDVKPANVLLTREAPGLKLVDFGISKLGTDTESTITADSTFSQPGETRAGAIMGTPDFMSPEQRTDASSVTDRADLYALGILARQILTGDVVPAPLPEEFAILERCTRDDPDTRPTAEQVREAMAILAGTLGAKPLEELVAWDALGRRASNEETLFA